MGAGESSSVSISGTPELPAGRPTVESVIAPEKLGARVVEAPLMVLLAEVEVAGAVVVAAATVVLSVEQVVETEDTAAPHKAL